MTDAALRTISRDELRAKIGRGDDFALVETLPRHVYDHAHLPGAVNLPPDRIAELAPVLFPDRGREIVVYCASPT
ncbi:MAG TPA: rhodanese-like domain-containing protein [Gemmatimonadota bacterium]|jgi:rhodanese-related sulfurtransferase